MTKKLSEKFEELTEELTKLKNEAKDNEDTKPVKIVEGVPFKIGEAYFIRTVTYFATGRVKAIVGQFLILEDAAWIADTGRFSNALATGVLSEVEPVEVDMFLNINSITDAFVWKHSLPNKVK